MALRQYDEEYVTSLEAEVASLQKERRVLTTKIHDLIAELERVATRAPESKER
jgi:hypothetical protein